MSKSIFQSYWGKGLVLLLIYIVQILTCELRIFIPHLQLVDKNILYIYRYGSTSFDGFIPLVGVISVFGGMSVHLETYELNRDQKWVIIETKSKDMFIDFPRYVEHNRMARDGF